MVERSNGPAADPTDEGREGRRAYTRSGMMT